MAYLYNITRILLQQGVAKYASYIEGRVLDAGSGGYDRYGQLFSPDSVVHLDIAEGPNVDVVGSVESLPFGADEFDSVISTQVLEHVVYPEKAVAEMCRVLKRGGHALVTVPQWNELHEEPHDYWRYTCYGMKALFERNGFSVVAYERVGGFFSNRSKMTMRYLTDRFRLYDRWFTRLVSAVFKVWGRTSMWLDSIDASDANRKHTIGWVFLCRKH